MINSRIKNVLFNVGMLVIGIVIGWIFFGESDSDTHDHSTITQTDGTIYTCSMHPSIQQNKPGLCPICGMDLVPLQNDETEATAENDQLISMSPTALALASVQTDIVKKGVAEKRIQLLGKVVADERNMAELTARFGGRIEKLFVNYTGQNIAKGEKLAIIYSPELITAQRELLEAYKFQSSNPQFYNVAKMKLKLWSLTDEQIMRIEKNLEPQNFYEILSPITGTVTKRQISIGDYVSEGTALFQVVDLTKVWVMFDAYEIDLPWIKKGDKITFSIQSFPGEHYEGSVTYIDPFIDPKNRVAKVRVELNNNNLKLKPEMFASGSLYSKNTKNTNDILIPKSAILWTGKRAVVYVQISNNTKNVAFTYREITLGPETGNFYVVKEGLKEGEIIATHGVFKIDAAAQLAGKNSMMNKNKKITNNNIEVSHEYIDESKMLAPSTLVQTFFKVSGNCEMCKNRIEKAVNGLDGINLANWNVNTKMMNISYNKLKISIDDIQKAIVDVGHDTENMSSEPSVYEKLPPCCQYTKE